MTLDRFLPDRRVEEDQQWEQLQSTGQHVKHQYKLGEYIELSEILCRSDLCKSGSHVVDGGQNRCKVGDQILILEGNCKDRDCKDNNKRNEKYVDGADHLMIDRLALHIDLAHTLRMNVAV